MRAKSTASSNTEISLAVLVIAALALGGCGAVGPRSVPIPRPSAEQQALGTWELLHPDQVTPESTSLEVGVQRVGCAGGVTGEVLEPQVNVEAAKIVIQTDVAALPDGAYTCPSNDTVAITIKLPEPVGSRELVDAVCLDTERQGHAYCTDGGIRWAPSVK